jgi:beta-1,2-mannobiose phosphorylase / 1,2-beta-oligomannan phosphorylase
MQIKVTEDVQLRFEASPHLAAMYHLSPYIWRDKGGYSMLLRVVNRSDVAAEKVARIHFGTSDDGLRFSIEENPVLAPGPAPEDVDGCEDPTVEELDGTYYVYYTGWNQKRKEASLLFAVGRNARELNKCGLALSSNEKHRNPKEATVHHASTGWRLFFEYSRDNRSYIGLAAGTGVDGPWTVLPDPFGLRPQGWDRGMLSPGPLVRVGDGIMMFYNGTTDDDHWKIGWIVFDDELAVRERCEQPILHGSKPEPGARDMAFANSAVVIDRSKIWLYYSVADMQVRRASIQVR